MRINISTKTMKYNQSYNLYKLSHKIGSDYKKLSTHNFINLRYLKKLISRVQKDKKMYVWNIKLLILNSIYISAKSAKKFFTFNQIKHLFDLILKHSSNEIKSITNLLS